MNNQRIISFCLWGNKPIYNVGAVRNAEIFKKFYPDFKCRFYIHRPSVPQETLDKLAVVKDVELVLRYDSEIKPNRFMAWRFEPHDDANVELFISRDTDSRLTQREAEAVYEWIESGKTLHIMRDSPCHYPKILGGMWGMRKLKNFIMCKEIDAYFTACKEKDDQQFLENTLYYRLYTDAVVHDEIKKYEPFCRPFKTKWGSDAHFIGQYVDENERQNTEYQNIQKQFLSQYMPVNSSSPLSKPIEPPVPLTHVILACDNNKFYYEFYPIVRKYWIGMKIQPILIFIGTDIPDMLKKYESEITLFKPLPNIPPGSQAQCIRILYPALLNLETFVITSDIDILPLSPSYFHDITKHSSESFILCKNIEHSYCVATPKVWKDIFNIQSISDIENILNSTQETWIRGQLKVYDMIQKRNKNVVIFNEVPNSFLGLDRDEIPSKPIHEYIHCRMPRPFNLEKVNSILNRVGITVFIIHYSKLTERRKNIETLLKNAGIDKYIFVDQFDRETLTPDIIDTNYQYNGLLRRPMLLSEISNFMAHRWCFSQIARMKANEVGLILEDDAIFNPFFKRDVITLIKDLPVYWDITYLGSNRPITETENIEACVSLYSNPFTCGYMVNSKFAKDLVNHKLVERSSLPIDDTFIEIFKDTKGYPFISSKRLVVEGSTEDKVFKSNMGRAEFYHSLVNVDSRPLIMLSYFRNYFHNSVFEFGCNCISTRFFSEFFNRALSVEVDSKENFEAEVKHKTSRNDILYIPNYIKSLELFEIINFNFELVYINDISHKEEYLNKAFNKASTIIVVGVNTPCILPVNYTCVRYDELNVSVYTDTCVDFLKNTFPKSRIS